MTGLPTPLMPNEGTSINGAITHAALRPAKESADLRAPVTDGALVGLVKGGLPLR